MASTPTASPETPRDMIPTPYSVYQGHPALWPRYNLREWGPPPGPRNVTAKDLGLTIPKRRRKYMFK